MSLFYTNWKAKVTAFIQFPENSHTNKDSLQTEANVIFSLTVLVMLTSHRERLELLWQLKSES